MIYYIYMSSTEAHKRASKKYNQNNYDSITIRTRKTGDTSRAAINEAAAAVGMSLNAFIEEAIREKINGPGNIQEIEREPFFE